MSIPGLQLPPEAEALLQRLLGIEPAPRPVRPRKPGPDELPAVRPPVEAIDALVLELRRALAKGEDEAWDDRQRPDLWIGLAEDLIDRAEIADSTEAWMDCWAEIGALALRVIESARRKSGPPSGPSEDLPA